MIKKIVLIGGLVVIGGIFTGALAIPAPDVTCQQTVACTSNQIESCAIAAPFYFNMAENGPIKAGVYTFYLATYIDNSVLKSTCEFKNGNIYLHATNMAGALLFADMSDNINKWGGGGNGMLFCPGSINRPYTTENCKFST